MLPRNRIRELRLVKASSLRPHPHNWRTHPAAQQNALRGILAEVGYADALLARELDDGSLELIDGHLRAETTPEMEVPVLVLDVSAEEAAKLLAVLDPLANLAGVDQEQFAELAVAIQTESPALRSLITDLAGKARRDQPTSDTMAKDARFDLEPSWEIVVRCADEAQQEELFQRLTGEGFPCRVLSL